MELNIPLVLELMAAAPPSLRSDRTLEEAAAFMREHKAVAVPVVTPGGNFVAVLNEFQLLRFFLKRSQETPNHLFVGNYISEMEPAKVIEEMQPITEAFKVMIQTPSRRVFVTKDGKITGVLEPAQLYEFMITREGRKLGA